MKITNKDVIQSYILTVSKYDFNVEEKRIMFRLIELVQKHIEGQKIDPNFSISKTLYGDREVVMPVAKFLKGENDENYTRVKKALTRLRNKTIEYEDNKVWKIIGFIEKPKFYKKGYVKFELQPEIYDALFNFSKGFRKYELKTIMLFESHYTMRFYELFSGQKKPITYSIDNLKIMFKIEDKYKKTNDFFKRVIDSAKKELDAKSPYSFEYKKIKDGRKIVAIKFYPVYHPQNRDPELERKELQKKTSLQWDLDPMLINYLKHNFLFTTDEIKHNIGLFKSANSSIDLMFFFSTMRVKCESKQNPKGYLINALKKELESN